MKKLGFVFFILLFVVSCKQLDPKFILIPREKSTPIIIPQPIPINIPNEISLKFYEIPKISGRVNEQSLYGEIMNRTTNQVFGYDRDTNAHETTHMIQSDMRNSRRHEYKHNSFYVVGRGGIDLAEPNMNKSAVILYVPGPLRGFRFPTYVSGASDWDDRPLYLVDEWCAYLNGAEVALEDIRNNRHTAGMYDGVRGPLEFSIYCTAMCMAISDKDPTYWDKYPETKQFIKEQLIRSYKLFSEGIKTKYFKGYNQEEYLSDLRNNPACENIRNYMKNELDDIWLSGQ